MTLPDPAFEAWIEDARRSDLIETAKRLQPTLKRAGNDWNAACPMCGGSDKNEFVITPRKGVFLCRKSGEGGDVIKMVQHSIGCDFVAAVEWITGQAPPRGEGKRTDPDVLRERREDRHGDRIEAARDHKITSTRAMTTARDVFEAARDIKGTQGEAYFKARGITLTRDMAMNLRYSPALDYRGYASEDANEETVLGTFPCVVAALRDETGEIVACHRTYLHPTDARALSPPGDQRRNRKKKIMGRPKGAAVLLGLMGDTVALGEGIETVASWFQLYEGMADVTPVSAYSLGNMAGNATGTLPHPAAQQDEQSRIPNGEPAMDGPGVLLPPEVNHVILIGDGDSDPARTRAFVLTAARRYRAAGLEVSISFAPKGTDWNDQIVRMVAGEPYEVPQLQPFDDFEREALALMRPAFKSAFGAVKWGELDSSGPQHEWLIKGVITRGEVCMLAGPSGSGKSFAAIDAAMAVARGVPWFGRKTLHGGVIYQAGESARGVRRKRLPAYRKHHGVGPEDDVPFVLLQRPIDLYASDDDATALMAEIEHWRGELSHGLELLVVDTFSAAIPGADENQAKDITPVLQRCQRIATKCAISVLLVHHMNAGGEKVRGSTAIQANLDSVLLCTKTDRVHSNGRKIREITMKKAKDENDEMSPFRFVLPSVAIGTDEDGDPVTSCVVINTAAYEEGQPEEKAKGFKINETEREFMQAFEIAIERAGIMPPAGVEVPSNVMLVVPTDEVRRAFKERFAATEEGDDEAIDARLRQRWSRATKGLLKFNLIGTTKTHIWMTGRPIQGIRLRGAHEIARQPQATEPALSPDDRAVAAAGETF